MWNHTLYFMVYTTVARIGFNQTRYTVSEEDDDGEGSEVEICINLTGELDRSVTVYLTTVNGSATGYLTITPAIHV